jgi:hypothetical protein
VEQTSFSVTGVKSTTPPLVGLDGSDEDPETSLGMAYMNGQEKASIHMMPHEQKDEADVL